MPMYPLLLLLRHRKDGKERKDCKEQREFMRMRNISKKDGSVSTRNWQICKSSAPLAVLVLASASTLVGCGRSADAVTPEKIEQQYGIAGAHRGDVSATDGSLKGTVVPVTLADGRQAQLFIPDHPRNDPHGVYLRDEEGLHPVRVKRNTTRDEITKAPAVVEKESEPQHEKKRSWEKDALIIGGSAGAGTAIGAVAGGKKGAAIGATAGGIGGLIYDMATRKND
jgi:hypothetical protein